MSADPNFENHRRVVTWVDRILDAPLPEPRSPHRVRWYWVPVAFAGGMLTVVAILVIPGAFQ